MTTWTIKKEASKTGIAMIFCYIDPKDSFVFVDQPPINVIRIANYIKDTLPVWTICLN